MGEVQLFQLGRSVKWSATYFWVTWGSSREQRAEPMGDMINVSCVDLLEKLEDELMEVVEVMGGGGDPTVVEGVVTCSHFSASSLIPPPPLLPPLAAGDLFALRDLLVAL